MDVKPTLAKYSHEVIVDLIRSTRNDLIKSFLVRNHLAEYLQVQHNLASVSAVRLEFMKRSLHELSASPIDLEHFGKLILEIRNAQDPARVIHESRAVFISNMEMALKSLIY